MVLMSSLSILRPVALPALFKKELVSVEATENAAAVLQCELTKPAPVEWRKGQKVLRPSEKHKMRLKDTVAELTIHSLEEEDAGDYTCVCGDKTTTASLTVHGNAPQLRRGVLLRVCRLVRDHRPGLVPSVVLNRYDNCTSHWEWLLLRVLHLGPTNSMVRAFQPLLLPAGGIWKQITKSWMKSEIALVAFPLINLCR